MTITQLQKKFQHIEIDLLLAFVLKKSVEFLYLHPQIQLTLVQKTKLLDLISKRLAGMPLAYLVKSKWFYHSKFFVNQHVLIPRPESEYLVTEALKFISAKINQTRPPNAKLNLLEVGTGSGCIIISIVQNTPSPISAMASDISEQALKVAQRNAQHHKVPIRYILSDLLQHINTKQDVVIANLPYVPVSYYLQNHKQLAYEPFLALTDGTDSAELISRFLKEAKKILKPKGLLMVEIDPSNAKQLKNEAKAIYQKYQVQIKKDLQGLYRYLIIKNI